MSSLSNGRDPAEDDPAEDDRSEEQIQADNDNHANQCNPNNDEYEHSREGDD